MKAPGLLLSMAYLLGLTTATWGEDYFGKSPPEPLTQPTSPVELSGWDSVALDGVSGNTIRNILLKSLSNDDTLNSRGRKEAEIYRNASPAVVMIVTNEGVGSGTYLGGGDILTNWHVVGNAQQVGVLFKPEREGVQANPASIVRGTVTRVDTLRDLALVGVAAPPANVRPLELGTNGEIQIGADVHAIGHPTGQSWTYTRGLISQFRMNYAWKAGSPESAHRASVIQTQTPINPGNSGGPLIADSGKLIGVNSFKAEGEGLNFAVSVGDVVSFLQSPIGQNGVLAPQPPSPKKCTPVRLYQGRNRSNDGSLVQIDTNCDGIADFSILTPDDTTQAILALIDSNYDGKTDIVVYDTDRDKRWDISFHDIDFDGIIDLVGYHSDGKIKPSRFVKYDPSKKY